MNKKNIGAALSVLAAVTAGATAYASTINNLDSDKNTNQMIVPNYVDNTYDYYSLVQSDYTKDLKNTAIANETRVVVNTNDTREEVEKIEKAAKDLVATTLITIEDEVVETASAAPVETEETVVTEEDEVVNYNNTALPEVEEEQVINETSDEVVNYDDSKLDDIFAQADADLEINETAVEADEEVVNYLENNTEGPATEGGSEEASANETSQKFVNVEALNIRSSKTMDSNTNIVRTLQAGTEVSGVIEEDGWLKTNEGYLALDHLADSYPQELINSMENKRLAEEAKKEEARKAEEARLAAEAKAAEEAQAVNEAQAIVESGTVVEEVAQQAPVEVVQQTSEPKGTAFTGWVYNTQTLNIRDKARNGNVLGTLNKGTRVDGELVDGWVKFDYNGKPAYVSASYLSNTEVVEAAPAATTNVQAVEAVVEEEEVVVEQAAAPVVNANGAQAANVAAQFVGSPYVYGSSNPGVGFDCSGLVVHSYKQVGVSLPHSSAAQFNTGYAVNSSALQPGDLVFFAINGGGIDHVGIVTSSDGTFIHASTPRTGVTYDNVYNAHYQRSFRGARRIF